MVETGEVEGRAESPDEPGKRSRRMVFLIHDVLLGSA
jgi:hypothetical protein